MSVKRRDVVRYLEQHGFLFCVRDQIIRYTQVMIKPSPSRDIEFSIELLPTRYANKLGLSRSFEDEYKSDAVAKPLG